MTDQSIPQPVADFIATVNAHDDAGFLDSFTDDAFVDDWGRTFTARDEIKGWSDKEFIGSQGVLTPEEVSADDDSVTVVGDWKSNYADGRSSFRFTTKGDKLTSMTIREG